MTIDSSTVANMSHDEARRRLEVATEENNELLAVKRDEEPRVLTREECKRSDDLEAEIVLLADKVSQSGIDYELAERVVELLNGMLEMDRPAVGALIANRVPCNRELADHPTVQVGRQHGGFHVGLLGIVNGICGIDDATGWGAITAVFDEPEDGVPDRVGNLLDLSHFKVVHAPGHKPTEET